MKLKLFSAALIACSFAFLGCKKVEGPGGSSTIKGKVFIQKYSTSGNLISEYFAQDEDVYLIYGNTDTFYDDDVKTSYDGTFEFNYLQKGDYKVFVYSDCSTCPSGKEVIIESINISGRKSTKDVGTITIRK